MDLQISNQLFIVGGATSGFGKAIAEALVKEGAKIIAIARGEEKLKLLLNSAPNQVETIAGDISDSSVIQALIDKMANRQVHGAVINAGGPPPKQF